VYNILAHDDDDADVGGDDNNPVWSIGGCGRSQRAQCVAVRTAVVCGSSVQQSGSGWECARLCVAVHVWQCEWQCEWQCVAVSAAVCTVVCAECVR
jgi:hypothetical protein